MRIYRHTDSNDMFMARRSERLAMFWISGSRTNGQLFKGGSADDAANFIESMMGSSLCTLEFQSSTVACTLSPSYHPKVEYSSDLLSISPGGLYVV